MVVPVGFAVGSLAMGYFWKASRSWAGMRYNDEQVPIMHYLPTTSIDIWFLSSIPRYASILRDCTLMTTHLCARPS